jgi:hypothetical protein
MLEEMGKITINRAYLLRIVDKTAEFSLGIKEWMFNQMRKIEYQGMKETKRKC